MPDPTPFADNLLRSSQAGNSAPPPTAHVQRPLTFCYLKSGEDKVVGPVPVQYLSNGGIGLVVKYPVALDTVATVQLFNKVRQAWITLPMRVEYLLALRGGGVSVRGTFTQELSKEEMEGLL